MLLLCGTAAVMLVQLRDEAWTSAARGAENLLAAVSQDVSRNIEVFDLSLQAVIEGLRLPGVAAMAPQHRRAVLFDRSATARYLGAIKVLDERGTVLEDAADIPTQSDGLADREFFHALRDSPTGNLFISGPFRLPREGQGDLVIALARRMNHPDGSFAGVVVGTLRLDYFKDLFARFSLGRDGTIVLSRADGVLLVRMPFNEELIGRDVSGGAAFRASLAQTSGTWSGVSSLDGVERSLFFTRIPDLPLVLTVALSPRDMYDAWNARATVIAVLLLVLCAATAVLFVLFRRELLRRDEAERQLRRNQEQYRLLADHASDVIIRIGRDMVRRYVSPSSLPVLGFRPDELVGRSAREVVHPEDWPRFTHRVAAAAAERGWFTVEYRTRHKEGHYIWVEGRCNSLPGQNDVMLVLRDVTARKKAEARLAHANAELTRLATTDGLTGLANRRHLDEMLEREWRRAAREGQPISLLMLDIDLFKQFNDSYGHGAGDDCLRRVATALSTQARRAADTAARYGGEEFVILLPGLELAQAVLLAQLVRSSVARLAIAHAANAAHASTVTVSIGVATAYPQPGPQPGSGITAAADLAAAADRALYDAKRGGRNRVAWPQPAGAGAGAEAGAMVS